MGTKLVQTEGYQGQLLKLAAGEPVALHFRARNRIILLTPGQLYGFGEHTLVISGIGEKCSVVDIRDLTSTPMIRAGLSAHAAGILREEITRTLRYANHQTIIENEAENDRHGKARPKKESNTRGSSQRSRRKEPNQQGTTKGKGKVSKKTSPV